jgi:energy-coupling factor transporter ATP-binding protein EcfA2
MRIERLILDQVGCFEHLDMTFREGRDAKKADIHLLVGANGTGKSTILTAMAQMFTLDQTGVDRRFWGADGYVLLRRASDGWAGFSFSDRNSLLTIPGGTSKSLNRVVATPLFDYYETVVKGAPASVSAFLSLSQAYKPFSPQYADTVFEHAAFAYGSARSIDASLDGIIDQQDSPLVFACVTPKPTSNRKAEPLIQWIANTSAKAAFAAERSDLASKVRYRTALDRIESVISEITKTRFRFVLSYEPISVSASINGNEVAIDVLPDGLKSLISWVGDLLMRLDRLPWKNRTPILDREITLFLDEIEVHLHPAWQRRILPVVQNLFPNAQVFVSTHSPFVIASADDAWIYPLYLDEKGKGHVGEILPSMLGNSYATVLRDVLGIEEEFAPQVQEPLKEFYRLRDDALKGDADAFARLKAKERELAAFGEEVLAVVRPEMRQVERRLGRPVAESD